MKKKAFLLVLVLLMVAVLPLTGCGKKEDKEATLWAVLSQEDMKSQPLTYTGDLTGEILAQGLSEWIGLDFSISCEVKDDGLYVDWSKDSTLITGLGDREQKDEFHMYDEDSLRWFMMDSLAMTLQKNLDHEKVYFTMDKGQVLRFDELYPVNEIPSDMPYEGSAFFFAHADVKGDMDDEEASGGNDSQGGEDLPYWNGMDFGPNLTYSEEYKLQADPGDYMNPAQGAQMVWAYVLEFGGLPAYSDDLDYQIVLVDLRDVKGAECYVYRIDSLDSGQTLGQWAYDYQSSINVYKLDEGGSATRLDSSWTGIYQGESHVIEISEETSTGFYFMVKPITTTAMDAVSQNEAVYEGHAEISDAGNAITEDGTGFSIYEDDGPKLDFFAAESGKVAYLRGQYSKIN